MKRDPNLSAPQAQAADRIGRRIADRSDLLDMTEGDILDVVAIAADAIGLPDSRFHAFKLKVYKTTLEQQPAFAERLVPAFRREIAASGN